MGKINYHPNFDEYVENTEKYINYFSGHKVEKDIIKQLDKKISTGVDDVTKSYSKMFVKSYAFKHEKSQAAPAGAAWLINHSK